MKNNSPDKLLAQQMQSFQVSTWIKLGIGSLMIIGGFTLLILGITGSIEIVIDAVDIKGKLINASPGIVFAFLGFLIVVMTHHRVSQAFQYDSKGVLRDVGLNVVHGMAGEIGIPDKRLSDKRLSKESLREL